MPNNNICKYLLLLSIALIVFLLLFFFIKKYNKGKSNDLQTFEQMNNQSVLLFKTHTWNSHLEKFVKKIKNESVPHRIDFYILVHSNDHTLQKQISDPELKEHVLVFDENEIKKTYSQGFYSMWLSNHWILMWFYKQFKNKYQYYWSIEYDVRISGDSSKIWTYNGTEDFIYPVGPFQSPEWRWKNHYVGGTMTDKDKWYGYLQLARYSKKFLDYLNSYYEKGENGQDEMMAFSLLKRGEKEIGLTGSNKLLYPLIKGSWTVDNNDSDKHKEILSESETKYRSNKNHLMIFHPVKY